MKLSKQGPYQLVGHFSKHLLLKDHTNNIRNSGMLNSNKDKPISNLLSFRNSRQFVELKTLSSADSKLYRAYQSKPQKIVF